MGVDSSQSQELQALPYVAVLDADPGLADPKEASLNFETQLKMKPKAMILLANASGTTPETLNPFIKETVELDIPVFLLSKNYAYETGEYNKYRMDLKQKRLKRERFP